MRSRDVLQARARAHETQRCAYRYRKLSGYSLVIYHVQFSVTSYLISRAGDGYPSATNVLLLLLLLVVVGNPKALSLHNI